VPCPTDACRPATARFGANQKGANSDPWPTWLRQLRPRRRVRVWS
jgi:hypothetical protein